MIKYLFLFLLISFQSLAQKPLRHYDFVSRKQPGMYVGEFSVSPRGNMLLATFNDLDTKAVYELVNIADGKLLSSGPLLSMPYSIAWTDDEKLVAIKYSTGPVCYEVKAGMKKLFSARMEGEPVFSRNGQLLSTNFIPELYVFGDDLIQVYNTKGILIDSIEVDHPSGYAAVWFDLLNNRFAVAGDAATELYSFSRKDKTLKLLSTSLSAGSVDDINPDKDGAKFFYYDTNGLYVHSSTDGKKITSYKFNKISTACFTPDSKNVLVSDETNMSLLSLQGKLIASIKRPSFYSYIFYTAFGTEMVAANPDGFDVFPCKDYFFIKEQPVVTNPPANKPPVKTEPVVPVKPVLEDAVKPWMLSYTIRDFIAPFTRDSFYLYSIDRSLRYFIKYQKGEPSILWNNPVNYFQYFGFSRDVKFQTLNSYILDMTDSSARMASYARSGLVEKPQMIGGQNYLGKISAMTSGSVSWQMKLFDEEYVLVASVIDNTYNGRKAKCLVVKRDDPKNGINETLYYQQGVGLIKIESNGKVAFER